MSMNVSTTTAAYTNYQNNYKIASTSIGVTENGVSTFDALA